MQLLTKFPPILSVSSVLTYPFFLHQYPHIKRPFISTVPPTLPMLVHVYQAFSKTAHPNFKRGYLQGLSRWGNSSIWTFLRPISSTKEMSTVTKLFPTVHFRESINVWSPLPHKNPADQLKIPIFSQTESSSLCSLNFTVTHSKQFILFQGLFFTHLVLHLKVFTESKDTPSQFSFCRLSQSRSFVYHLIVFSSLWSSQYVLLASVSVSFHLL